MSEYLTDEAMRYFYGLIGLVILVGLAYWADLAQPKPEPVPETRKIFVYYALPTETDMDFVAVEREVEAAEPLSETALLALRELVKGPTEAERGLGLVSSFNDGTEVNSVKVTEPGMVTIDFNEIFDTPMGGSARVRAISESIQKTFQQFDQTTKYEFTFTVNNGEREAVLEP